MDITLFPTKGNLILSENTLKLSKQGYDLLDKKRNILVKEMMSRIDRIKKLRSRIKETFGKAYMALQAANIMHGVSNISDIGHAISHEDSVKVGFSSVMGVEIPNVFSDVQVNNKFSYGFRGTSSALDMACYEFNQAKILVIELAEVENAIFKIADGILKTQKRANALKNIAIPKYQELVKYIKDSLEEKDREEFTRLKVVKNKKTSK